MTDKRRESNEKWTYCVTAAEVKYLPSTESLIVVAVETIELSEDMELVLNLCPSFPT